MSSALAAPAPTRTPEKAAGLPRLRWVLGLTFFLFVIAVSIPTVIMPIATQGDRWNVISGSMEPSIMVGDMTVSHPVELTDIKIGDVLVYQHPEVSIPVTHRVVDIRGDKFILRGDANPVDDPPVTAEQIMGKMSYQVPGMGHTAKFVDDNRAVLTTAYAGMIAWFIFGGRRAKRLADGGGTSA